jgi:hypothetical protein
MDAPPSFHGQAAGRLFDPTPFHFDLFNVMAL